MPTTNKIPHYRKLAESCSKLAAEHEKAIITTRHRLMYHYFLRCSGLTSAVLVLVEAGLVGAAYALEKSLVDALLNGLYIGYVASDKEIEDSIAMAMKGRCTGHSKMKKRAKLVDTALRQRKAFLSIDMFEGLVGRNQEALNEFGHGGLLSTMLDVTSAPAEVENRILSRAVLALLMFLGSVALLENLDLAPLEDLQKEFTGIGGELVEAPNSFAY